jgi:branched-chain amino acid transport system substrate-binding protein
MGILRKGTVRSMAAAILLVTGSAGMFGEGQAIGPLKLGLLLNFSEGSTGRAADRKRAFDLAVKHLNAGGGVLGHPVEVAAGDSTRNPIAAVAEARRLVEDENIHALVGPSSSANTLAVAEQVTGPAGIPTVSPSASSPRLTTAADRDFLFRTVVSDSAQGPVLARITRERGFDNVGVIYRDDAWGTGLADAFAAAWDGEITTTPFAPAQATMLAELRLTAGAGAQALVVIASETEAVTIIREALDHRLYHQFTFGDAARSPAVVGKIGGQHLGGMLGTAGATAPDNPATDAWEGAFAAEYGQLPAFAYVKETYDAAIALALAAQAAGSTRGAAIRDQLRAVGSEPGTVVHAGLEGVATALRILAAGGAVDYEGAAVTLDWDRNGDLERAHIGIWRFTEDERIETVDVVPWQR